MKLFGWLKKDNKPKQNEVKQDQQMAPGTQISHDAKLIEHFKKHHRALESLITQIKTTTEAGEFESAQKHLRKFKILLNEHLLEENLRLYTYLSYCLKNDTEGAELMDEMRREMSAIGRKVARFIKHYSEFGINAQNAPTFLSQLAQVTAVLGDRIEREERSLYSLYLPPHVIQNANA